MLAFGTQVRGFKPGRNRRIFQGEKVLSTPSFGREVKPFVPCRRFTACKRSLNVTWKSGIFRLNSSAISRISRRDPTTVQYNTIQCNTIQYVTTCRREELMALECVLQLIPCRPLSKKFCLVYINLFIPTRCLRCLMEVILGVLNV